MELVFNERPSRTYSLRRNIGWNGENKLINKPDRRKNKKKKNGFICANRNVI